jgi:hypothetical protein
MLKFYYRCSKRSKGIVSLVAGCLMMFSSKAQLGVNLIVNGDAEQVPVTSFGWTDVADLGSFPYADQGIWYLPDSSTYPAPQHTDNGTHQAHGGKYFFSAGVNSNPGAGQMATLVQTIDLVADGLTGQALTFAFSGFVSTDGNSALLGGDIVNIRVEYINSASTVVYAYDPEWTASGPTDFNWNQLTNTQNVLVSDGIVTVRITLEATNNNSSSTIQGFYDDLSLVATLTLPINLLDFQAVQQTDHSVLLTWQTAQEQNSHFIEVQRSGNAKDFASIGQVPAAGNSNLVKDYSFADPSPLAGNNFYRLRLVDLDGSYTYSKILEVTATVSGQSIEVFSNPFHDQIGVRVRAEIPDKVVFTLTDILGRPYLQQSYGTLTGNNFFSLPTPAGMAAGVYLLNVRGTNMNQTVKVLKQ